MTHHKHNHTKKRTMQDEVDDCSVKSEYDMISDIFNFQTLMDHEKFTVKIYKNSVYKGMVNPNNERDGQGIYVAESGLIYEGYWREDKRNGDGYQKFKNGNIYRGAFMNNKPHGKGVYTWVNGEIYDGEWIQGSKNGFGTWKGLNGDFYKGDWCDNKC